MKKYIKDLVTGGQVLTRVHNGAYNTSLEVEWVICVGWDLW